MPTVSVVITTYNRAKVMLETLESVLKQTYTDFEVIVVSDGSTDNTAEVLAPYVQSGRVRFLEQKNQGPSVARNTGLAAAEGRYICFLDDDDLWPEDKLTWQVNAWEKAEADCVLVYGYWQPFFEDEIFPWHTDAVLPSGRVLYDFCERNWIGSPGQVMLRTAVVRSVGGFDPDLFGPEDRDLWIRLAKIGTFYYEQRVALYYRLQVRSVSRNRKRMHDNIVKLVNKHIQNNPDAKMVALLRPHLDIARADALRLPNPLHLRTMVHATRQKEAGNKREALRLLMAGGQQSPELWRDRNFLRLFAATLAQTILPGGSRRNGSSGT